MIYTWIIAIVMGHGMSYIPVEYSTEESCKVAAADYMSRHGAQTKKLFQDYPGPREAYCQSVLKTKVK